MQYPVGKKTKARLVLLVNTTTTTSAITTVKKL